MTEAPPSHWIHLYPERETIALTVREDAATGCRAVGALEGLTITIWDLPHPSVAIGCARQQDRGPRVPLHPLVREGGSASQACYPACLIQGVTF